MEAVADRPKKVFCLGGSPRVGYRHPPDLVPLQRHASWMAAFIHCAYSRYWETPLGLSGPRYRWARNFRQGFVRVSRQGVKLGHRRVHRAISGGRTHGLRNCYRTSAERSDSETLKSAHHTTQILRAEPRWLNIDLCEALQNRSSLGLPWQPSFPSALP
jgi:hypothetical protein